MDLIKKISNIKQNYKNKKSNLFNNFYYQKKKIK